ncbi:hypothetical protein NM688_g934 [Phlebia brevispora]|uniref:Uncharacterized protein n=1 Tax=Phlebia brevispora TaxID=194682 RepID=A0ACC1TCL7_9APHY|nr:hypothetical protein NM688_g934 [Phlebia brevispora]
MPVCLCGQKFNDDRHYNKHKKKCTAVRGALSDAVENAHLVAEDETERPPKRPRWETILSLNRTDDHVRGDPGLSFHERPQGENRRGAGFLDLNLDPPPACEPDEANDHRPPQVITRAGRVVRPSQKVLDTLPEEAGVVEASSDSFAGHEEPATTSDKRPARVTLLLTERIRTAANRFGISRLYKRKPSRAPSKESDLARLYTPTAPTITASRSRRTIRTIIAPFPNLSSWLFSHHYWINGHKKTQEDRQMMQGLLTRDDFNTADIRGVNFKKLDEELAADDTNLPWVDGDEGWKCSPLVIDIPLGQKPTNLALRETASAQRRADRLEAIPDEPVNRPFRGQPYTVNNLWHKDLTAEIKTTLESDPAAAHFVFDPCLLHCSKSSQDDTLEGVYGELYNSPVAVQEDLRLQNSAREEGCNLPRAIAKIILYTDSTNVTQFGNTSMWPGYLWFGNQSKYERARPTAHAAHHIAYFPKLPDSIQEEIRRLHGKPATAALLTHLRRDLWHAGWEIILDDKFMVAYHHGIIVDCADGVRRRIYPRIFLYSADYPEKMLVAALRDKGKYPCPHCGVTFDDIFASGTEDDRKLRQATIRKDNEERRRLVDQARELIYDNGYVVNSDRVDGLLKSRSLVPTINAFSAKLATMPSFDCYKMLAPDVMHELELGVWKSVFAHLIRILESLNPDLINELNARFRQVPIFGENTIRKFAANVSDMSNMAALHYEDILQCSIPVFEGLLPEPHNSHIISLLYSMAYFHCLAKMRLHTDTSVALLDQAYSVMASHLRHFQMVVCPHFQTKETLRECAARVRAQANSGAVRGRPSVESSSARKPRSFNMSTIKMHLLGYYAIYIPLYGTTDGYSTKIGEHEHRRVKARRMRTNLRNSESQMADIDLRERRLHRMAAELTAQGVSVPGYRESSKQNIDEMRPEDHHKIAQESDARIALYLRDIQAEHADDPALEDFGSRLYEHIHQRFLQELSTDEGAASPLVHAGSILIKHERIYRHATLRINFTTYDIQRDQDVIHCYDDPSGDKIHILVHAPYDSLNFPWRYATVLGVFHAEVLLPDHSERRLEFLWVRWLEIDPTWISGPGTRRLERVQYATEEAYSFLDPATVIRGCHLIPAFHYGRDVDLTARSVAHTPGGDWKYYYVDRFVDRDMGARFAGLGLGNLGMKARYPESLTVDTAMDNEAFVAHALSLQQSNHGSSATSSSVTTGQGINMIDEEDYENDEATLLEGEMDL